MAEENTGGLTASEQAYFESGGTTEVVESEVTVTEPAAQVEAPQPGTTEQPELAAQERDEKGKFVPHGALHAEREEHKKTKAALEEIQRNQAVLNDRWNTLLAANKQQEQPKEDTPPDPTEDIIGHLQWQAKQFEADKAERQKQTQEQQQREQATQQEQAIWSEWDSSVTQVKASIADFDDATGFLANLRDNQLKAFASVDPNFGNQQTRVAQINAELRQIILQAKQSGQDPAAVVYQLAQGYGYTNAKQPNPQQETIDKINMIDEAQRGSKTLAASNGTNTGDPLSAEAIAAMPAKEFDAWLKDPANERRFNALMGA